METRNLIKSGPSSYIVSVPLGWIKKNNLKKGDFLYLEERENNLIYSAMHSHEETRGITIEIDDKSDEHIEKVFKSAYLASYNTFIFKGSSIKDRIKELREMINRLVAVEIMEQTSARLVAQEMLDKKKNSPERIIKRMDMIIRGMFDDLSKSLGKEDIREYIGEKELDINRLHMLAQRLIFVYFQNPAYASEIKKSNFEMLIEFKIIGLLEMIADSIDECSSVSGKLKSNMEELLSETIRRYAEAMEIYYKNDKNKAVSLSITTKEALKKAEGLLRQNADINSVQFIIPIREIIITTDEIALAVLNKNT